MPHTAFHAITPPNSLTRTHVLAQDAPKNGAMFFEVTAANGAKTHCGVLDFTAPEGVALLPPKVAHCLFGLPEEQAEQGVTGAAAAGDAAAEAASTAASASSSEVPSGAAEAAAAAAPIAALSTSGAAGGVQVAAAPSPVHGRVAVSYVILPKGDFVRLQPQLRAFHEDVGADEEAREALEAALVQHSTLTEGDWVEVRGSVC